MAITPPVPLTAAESALQLFLDEVSKPGLAQALACLRPDLTLGLNTAVQAGQAALNTRAVTWVYWTPTQNTLDYTTPPGLKASDAVEVALASGEVLVGRVNQLNWGSTLNPDGRITKYRKVP